MPPVIGLPDLELKSIEYDKKIYVEARLRERPNCIRCGSQRLHIKYSFNRSINHSRLGNQVMVVRYRSHKYKCLNCGRYFNLKIQGVLPKRRSSESFRLEVFESHGGGVSQKYLSETHDISHATVERWYKEFIKDRISELSGRKVPLVLGIDEHFFSKKKGYATTFVDLKNHKVFDVVLGRSEKSLEGYLKKLPDRDRVRVVVMDLSSTYRSIVRKYFPNAKIVADRFHVVRLLNQQFLKAWKQFDPIGRQDRGLLSLMRRHYENLSPEQEKKLEKYFAKYPYLKVLWEFKHKLHDLMRLKTLSKQGAWKKIHELLPMLDDLKQSPIEALKTLGETFYSWRDEIGRMWRFSKTNGITEGLHNKMEMISRRAFGFRNFENYRMRVLALCGWNGVINRTRKYI
ncbi:MAG: ISL3 family transposase [Bdellovibrionaceae bacterium]|nr:ISL3 family transposase [Pseudobdellovibrionaceae bacterium]